MRKILLIVGVSALSLVGCGDSGGTGSGTDGTEGSSSGSGGGTSAVCDSTDYQAKAATFCETQHPPAPGPGELGASCTGDGQCDSGTCLEPFGQAAYCSLECPAGNECSIGYSCQDTGAGFSACYQDVCIYGGSDTADCVTNLLAQIDHGCNSDCTKANVDAWVDCLGGAGRLCNIGVACGAELGILESCCVGCSGDW